MSKPHERFARSLPLFGKPFQDYLGALDVAVAGLGGVGSFALEALARCGIGKIRLIDKDRIEASNFNRQMLATDPWIGCLKTEAARERIHAINPACKTTQFPIQVEPHSISMDSFLHPPADFLLDAIDDLDSKTAMLGYAMDHGIATVSSMGAAGRFDPACVKVEDIARTNSCPLARKLRRMLRRNGVPLNIRCVFSDEKPHRTSILREDAAKDRDENAAGEEFFSPSVNFRYGSYIGVTAVFGILAAHEIIRMAFLGFKKE